MNDLTAKVFSILPDKTFIQLQYIKNFFRFPDLEYPKLFSEKIQWMKLYDRKKTHIRLSDKYEVRDYIKSIIGAEYLNELFVVSDNPEEIKFDELPLQFVIKANHGSGFNRIVWDKSKVNWTTIVKQLRGWLNSDYYLKTREWQYKEINRKILIEELLSNDSKSVPLDYKFHCFNGKVELIQVDIDRFSNHKRNLYNTEWELLPLEWSPAKNNKPNYPKGEDVERPANLVEMINLSERISCDFNYVRVDLFEVNNKVIFGEITFHHENGMAHFFPSQFDEIYGAKINLDIK